MCTPAIAGRMDLQERQLVAGRLFWGPFYSRALSIRCWEMELGTEWRKVDECKEDGKVTALGG